jgi:hypothetical protein
MKIPCKDCLTFAICRSSVLSQPRQRPHDFLISSLLSRCSIFKEYCFKQNCIIFFYGPVGEQLQIDRTHKVYHDIITFFIEGV